MPELPHMEREGEPGGNHNGADAPNSQQQKGVRRVGEATKSESFAMRNRAIQARYRMKQKVSATPFPGRLHTLRRPEVTTHVLRLPQQKSEDLAAQHEEASMQLEQARQQQASLQQHKGALETLLLVREEWIDSLNKAKASQAARGVEAECLSAVCECVCVCA